MPLRLRDELAGSAVVNQKSMFSPNRRSQSSVALTAICQREERASSELFRGHPGELLRRLGELARNGEAAVVLEIVDSEGELTGRTRGFG